MSDGPRRAEIEYHGGCYIPPGYTGFHEKPSPSTFRMLIDHRFSFASRWVEAKAQAFEFYCIDYRVSAMRRVVPPGSRKLSWFRSHSLPLWLRLSWWKHWATALFDIHAPCFKRAEDIFACVQAVTVHAHNFDLACSEQPVVSFDRIHRLWDEIDYLWRPGELTADEWDHCHRLHEADPALTGTMDSDPFQAKATVPGYVDPDKRNLELRLLDEVWDGMRSLGGAPLPYSVRERHRSFRSAMDDMSRWLSASGYRFDMPPPPSWSEASAFLGTVARLKEGAATGSTTSPPPDPQPTAEEKPAAVTPAPLAGLTEVAAKADLSPLERKVVDYVADHGGTVLISDAQFRFDGSDVVRAFKRAGRKLKRFGWKLHQSRRSLVAKPLSLKPAA